MTAQDHVFISYAHKDAGFVLPLATRLQQYDVRVWLDDWSIQPGDNWDLVIDRAIDNCTHFLVVLSPYSVESLEVMGELRAALDERKKIVPVLYQECRIPRALRLIHYIDFTGREPDDEEAFGRLLHALGVPLPPTKQPPPEEIATAPLRVEAEPLSITAPPPVKKPASLTSERGKSVAEPQEPRKEGLLATLTRAAGRVPPRVWIAVAILAAVALLFFTGRAIYSAVAGRSTPTATATSTVESTRTVTPPPQAATTTSTAIPTRTPTADLTSPVITIPSPTPAATPTTSGGTRPTAAPTATPTDTPVPPTDTPRPEPTDTPRPEPTDTPRPTDTPAPTDTPQPTPTNTLPPPPTPTNTMPSH
ncbi:MAG: TIR domain-containing protein [Anaerolineae bacterium]|nr:TIR domain-containing protein [Anaerolineae bacterium]